MSSVIVCLIGAIVGMVVATVGARIALPFALRSQQSMMFDRLPWPLNDRARVETLTRNVYRFVMPLLFGAVGAVGAYTIWFGRAAE